MIQRLLTHMQGLRDGTQALAELWGSLEEALAPSANQPVVIQIGAAGRTALAIDTAHSLARWLAERRAGARIEIADALATLEPSPGTAAARWITGETVPVG